jgi:MFS family permease
MVTVIIGDIFGTRSIGTIMGVLSGGWAIGAAAGPAIGGFVFDASGSYFLAFGAGAAASLMAALAITPVKKAG